MVNPPRALILFAGPLVLVGLCYWLAAPASWEAVPVVAAGVATTDWPLRQKELREALQGRCELRAAEVSRKCPTLNTFIAPPLVLAGELTRDELQRLHQETIQPTFRALSTSYFDEPLTTPVTILLFAREESFRDWMRSLPKMPRAEYAGLYLREQRTVALNLATGEGTLAHELTHALAHADFPQLPEWFDEGLASLHEECEFADHGHELLGLDNWRRRPLMEAVRNGRLKSLEALFTDPFARADLGPLDYAHARYFCLYLQQQQLLAPFYRKCRASAVQEATGRKALSELFPDLGLSDVDEKFRAWLKQLPEPVALRPATMPR